MANTQHIPENLTPRKEHKIGMTELVVMTASLWALNAFAIDMMLPALGTIGADLGTRQDNDRQLMIVIYVVVNGFAQLFFGPLVDRYGRRTILLWALGGYIIASLLSIFATTFTFMLFARALQGATTAATRVASIAVVRDRVSGRKMAQVISMVITVFMAAPIIAPGIGQLILMFGPWRWIFATLMFYGIGLTIWVFLRVPETLESHERKPLKPETVLQNYLIFFRNRTSLGYTIAGALVFASLFAFLSSSEQIFIETYSIGDLFALAFAIIALPLGIASVVNSRLVEHYGMRRITHTAIVCFLVVTFTHLILYKTGFENFWVFEIAIGISFFCIGLMAPNCTAIAMEPMGNIAGSAGAANGFASTAISGILGGLIARGYDGTPAALIYGMTLVGIGSFIVVLLTEKGQLFAPIDRQTDHTDDE